MHTEEDYVVLSGVSDNSLKIGNALHISFRLKHCVCHCTRLKVIIVFKLELLILTMQYIEQFHTMRQNLTKEGIFFLIEN